VKRLLTHTSEASALRFLTLLPLFLALPKVSSAADTTMGIATGNPPSNVRIKERTFEQRREPDSRLTWVVQKTTFEDGLTVVTLAGAQFSDALGLALILVDDVTPQPLSERTRQTLEDIPPNGEKRLPGEAARIDLQLRNVLLDLKELKSGSVGLQSVPQCEQGRRRGVLFLRANQTGRVLELSPEQADTLTRWGRAACVRWDGFPMADLPHEAKTQNQTAVQSPSNESAQPH